MARTYWNIYYQESAGSWIADGTVPRPNDTLSYDYQSNQTTVQLADGSKAYITPETKYTRNQLTFMWYQDDGTYKTKIQNYIINNEYLKIECHTGTNFIGRFIGLKSSHLTGQDDVYDLEATFEWIEE
jgi:hypothetical protein